MTAPPPPTPKAQPHLVLPGGFSSWVDSKENHAPILPPGFSTEPPNNPHAWEEKVRSYSCLGWWKGDSGAGSFHRIAPERQNSVRRHWLIPHGTRLGLARAACHALIKTWKHKATSCPWGGLRMGMGNWLSKAWHNG